MAEINYKALGLRIKKSRKEKNITQEKLGEICSLSTAHIGHIERGTRIPSLDTIFKIACELNVSVDYLLFDSFDKADNIFAAISAHIKDKNDEKVKFFLKTVKALAESIDEY